LDTGVVRSARNLLCGRSFCLHLTYETADVITSHSNMKPQVLKNPELIKLTFRSVVTVAASLQDGCPHDEYCQTPAIITLAPMTPITHRDVSV